MKSLVHETGHAISIIELKPKSYVYFSFPKATGPQDNPMTMPTKEANLPQYRKALFYLFGVIMEIIAFILFYYIVKYLIWKKEWTKTKDKITNIKKLKFFIFPKIIKLENNTFPLSPDLIKYVSYILIFSIFNNWILLSSGTDIVKFFDTVNIRNGYLFFQKLFATIGLPFIVPFLIDNLIILYLALLVFHQIFNLIIKNKKLYLYLLYFFSILLFVIIIWIIHFQLGNVVLEF